MSTFEILDYVRSFENKFFEFIPQTKKPFISTLLVKRSIFLPHYQLIALQEGLIPAAVSRVNNQQAVLATTVYTDQLPKRALPLKLVAAETLYLLFDFQIRRTEMLNSDHWSSQKQLDITTNIELKRSNMMLTNLKSFVIPKAGSRKRYFKQTFVNEMEVNYKDGAKVREDAKHHPQPDFEIPADTLAELEAICGSSTQGYFNQKGFGNRRGRFKQLVKELLMKRMPAAARKRHLAEFDPLEALQCRYLRLSPSNIEDLMTACKEAGVEVDFLHPHSNVEDLSEYVFGHKSDQ
ncbi:hypothetical protein BSL78_16200 [Apostichopus japonicus]|uniref:Uncharacterized protein n=1 Tax=Stichopus japonicus TaxID=307972 RepID=A0A2G8KG43_STIJA|nr:hypothetical protein BSL78_16200 [Apostichopus japonicus]